jgi:hypothetical protein
MSFVRTFQELFGGIFGWPRPRPRLKLVAPKWWLCEGSMIVGVGETPQEAYFVWLRAFEGDTKGKVLM